MKDLSTNPELENEIFNKINRPLIKFYWKNAGDPDRKEFSSAILSASGTVQSEDDNFALAKSNFNIILDNNNDTDLGTDGGFFFPSNSTSIFEDVELKLGYKHNGAGEETITYTKGEIRSLSANTQDKTANLYCLDESKNFDNLITVPGIIKNKRIYQIVELVLNQLGYSTANRVGSKKLTIRGSSSGINTDEANFVVNFAVISKQKATDILQELIETSLGKIIKKQNGDIEYWSLEYFKEKYDGETVDFTANVITAGTTPSDKVLPIFSYDIDLSDSRIINHVNCNYYDFKINDVIKDLSEISLELEAGEEFEFSTDFNSSIIEQFEDQSVWDKFAYDNPEYNGMDYGPNLVISSVVNEYVRLSFKVKNNNRFKCYCKITPKVSAGKQYDYIEHKTEKIESDAEFVNGTFNYFKSKDKQKSISSTFIQNKSWANQISYNWISIYRYGTRIGKIKLIGTPHMELGDKLLCRNDLEVKNNYVFGNVKTINWNFSIQDGYTQDVEIDIYRSYQTNTNVEIEELFNDTSKTSLMQQTVIDGGELKLQYRGSGLEINEWGNGWFITDRFGSMNNIGIANEKTSSETNINTSANNNFETFKSLAITNNYVVIT